VSRFDEIELPEWAAVSVSVASDLARLPVSVTDCAEAAIALALARKLDSGGEISVAPVSKELREVLALLRARAGLLGEMGDAVDELGAARAARRSGAAG